MLHLVMYARSIMFLDNDIVPLAYFPVLVREHARAMSAFEPGDEHIGSKLGREYVLVVVIPGEAPTLDHGDTASTRSFTYRSGLVARSVEGVSGRTTRDGSGCGSLNLRVRQTAEAGATRPFPPPRGGAVIELSSSDDARTGARYTAPLSSVKSCRVLTLCRR